MAVAAAALSVTGFVDHAQPVAIQPLTIHSSTVQPHAPGKKPFGPEAESQLARLRTLRSEGHHGAALLIAERLLARHELLSDLLELLRGKSLLAVGRADEAAASFAAATRPPSRFIDRAQRLQAVALGRAGHHVRAAEVYRALLAGYPAHPRRPALEAALARQLEAAGQREAAASTWQRLWLLWPHSDAGRAAPDQLARLQARGVKIAPPSTGDLFARARRLVRVKHYREAIEQLHRIADDHPEHAAKVHLQLGYALGRAGKPKRAVRELQRAFQASSGRMKKQARELLIDALERAGDLKAALALQTVGLPRPSRRLRRRARKRWRETADTLAANGRYGEALALYRKLTKRRRRRRRRLSRGMRRRIAWLAYRAGEYAEAIALWRQAYRRDDEFALYWRGRARQKMGQRARAIALYRRVAEQRWPSYYRTLARSRLLELGKPLSAPSERAEECRPIPDPAVPSTVSTALHRLERRFGELLPGLRRARALWRTGLRSEARRELRLVALDVVWAIHHRFPRAFRVRSAALRVWRGGPSPRRTWGETERALRNARDELVSPLAHVLRSAGLSYLGWRLAGIDREDGFSVFPRPYAPIVEPVARQNDLHPHLIWAVMRTESAYRTDAVSRVGASGLMQLMPYTAALIVRDRGAEPVDAARLFSAGANLELAGYYLGAISRKFHGQLPLIAASYNGGPHNVARWLDQRGAHSSTDEFVEEIPFRESRRYAKKIVRLLSTYAEVYCGHSGPPISNQLQTDYLAYPSY